MKVEDKELHEKIAKEYNIKGYTMPMSLTTCYTSSTSEYKVLQKTVKGGKTQKRRT